jgi:hypothetical protein
MVGAADVAGGEGGAVTVGVGAPAGVIEKLVGVEAAFCGTWQASMPRMSSVMMLVIRK